MKKTTKLALGAVALIAVSAGVAGVTSYAILQSKDTKNASFYEAFQTATPAKYAAFDTKRSKRLLQPNMLHSTLRKCNRSI